VDRIYNNMYGNGTARYFGGRCLQTRYTNLVTRSGHNPRVGRRGGTWRNQMNKRVAMSIIDIFKAAGGTVERKLVHGVVHHTVRYNGDYLGAVVEPDNGSVRIVLSANSIFRDTTCVPFTHADIPSDGLEHVHDESTEDDGPACIICEKEVELRDGLCADHYGELVDLIANES